MSDITVTTYEGSVAVENFGYTVLVSEGHTIPAGGTEGQRLAKASDLDYDVEWVTASDSGSTVSVDADGTVTVDGTPVELATDAQLAAHEADTTNIHGIADTSLLETTTGSAAKVAAHEADTTNVHGIANTANLETATGAQSKADAAQAAAEATAAAALTAHLNDTVDAHDASAISFSPTGSVAAGDVQAAIAEVASDAAGLVSAEATARDAAIAAAIAALVASAPGVLDTLDEIAAALGDDPNFAATITTALAGKQPLDAELTALAGLTSSADKFPYFTGSQTAALATVTTFARSLLDDADAATARGTLGLGTAATSASGDFQPINSNLTSIAALTTTSYGRAFLELANQAALMALLLSASTTAQGIVELATTTETTTGTDTVRAVTPAGVKAVADTLAPLSHTHAASDIASGTIATARLGSGTADSTTYLRGDQTWQTVSTGATLSPLLLMGA